MRNPGASGPALDSLSENELQPGIVRTVISKSQLVVVTTR